MDAATEGHSAKAQLATLLAGLEGGTVGVLWMLAWLGMSSLWQQRSFWSPENLMSTAFDRNATLAPIFTWATCAGLALYVLIYSLLGAGFASALRDRAPRNRVMLLAVVFALLWYYFSFRWIFKFAFPLVALLHVEHTTVVGHLLYGTMLGRYPVYVQRLMSAGVAPAAGPVNGKTASAEAEPPALPAAEQPAEEPVASEVAKEEPEGSEPPV